MGCNVFYLLHFNTLTQLKEFLHEAYGFPPTSFKYPLNLKT